MKLNRLETHDRLIHLKQDQSKIIQQGAEDCLKRNSLSLQLQERSPYIYIFAHPRTDEDGVTKRLLWQPRLGKPKAQSNSYLFRAKSYTDNLEVCWILPPHETWEQFKKGNVTESDIVEWSINQFKTNKLSLEAADPQDYSEEQIRQILLEIAKEMEQDHRMKKIFPIITPGSVEVYPSFYPS